MPPAGRASLLLLHSALKLHSALRTRHILVLAKVNNYAIQYAILLPYSQ